MHGIAINIPCILHQSHNFRSSAFSLCGEPALGQVWVAGILLLWVEINVRNTIYAWNVKYERNVKFEWNVKYVHVCANTFIWWSVLSQFNTLKIVNIVVRLLLILGLVHIHSLSPPENSNKRRQPMIQCELGCLGRFIGIDTNDSRLVNRWS